MHLMTTAEVAKRLGVKPATVYAYVSRGLLSSHRNAHGKGSLFDPAEVDEFAAARVPNTTPAVQTGITLIKDGALFYRGAEARVLALNRIRFEDVAGLLWTGELDLGARSFSPRPEQLALARQVTASLPPDARITDRLRVITAAVATTDRFRFDTNESTVTATAQALLATMVEALPAADGKHGPGLAARLWPRLTTHAPEPELLNAALVLLADHDIAASTLAARVAASTRAHPYAVVSAGLAALDGPLHGAASALAHGLLLEAQDDPFALVAERMRTGERLPGFGHNLYPAGDTRADTLLQLLPDGPAKSTADRLAVASHVRPNIDLALAVLTVHFGMPADAGEAIFAIARTAGWIAHALEEYGARPVRFRFSSQYTGRPPA